VKLEVPIVRLVIKDLITFDGIKLQLNETEELIKLLNDKLLLKDTIIVSLNTKVANLEEIITKKDDQFDLEREKSKLLELEIKRQRNKTLWWKIAAGVGFVTILFLTIAG
jgi:signal transduction histidine kinase